jgi:hypothetical protein
MDPTSRFMAALALASSSMVSLGPGSQTSAADMSEEDMYQLCKDGHRQSCEAFLNAYPSSRYAPDVLGNTVDKSAGEKSGFAPDGGLIY